MFVTVFDMLLVVVFNMLFVAAPVLNCTLLLELNTGLEKFEEPELKTGFEVAESELKTGFEMAEPELKTGFEVAEPELKMGMWWVGRLLLAVDFAGLDSLRGRINSSDFISHSDQCMINFIKESLFLTISPATFKLKYRIFL